MCDTFKTFQFESTKVKLVNKFKKSHNIGEYLPGILIVFDPGKVKLILAIQWIYSILMWSLWLDSLHRFDKMILFSNSDFLFLNLISVQRLSLLLHPSHVGHVGALMWFLTRALNSRFSGFSEWDRKWDNCPALIRCINLDRRSFQRGSGRSKALPAESGCRARWYRLALISFTYECEMVSFVV